MCHACVMDSVKERMLSRRALFRGVAATGLATAATGLIAARPALAQSGGRVIDLTHTLTPDFPTFDGRPGIEMVESVNFEESGYQLYRVTFEEHSGTHIDAPLHFSEDGTSVDELDPATLVCPLCIVDISAKAAEDPNAMVEPADIEAWISANGDIPAGACVAMLSGWADKVGTEAFRTDADGNFAFPGFSVQATDMLDGMGVAAIGVDTLSLDPGNSADFAVHYGWLPAGRYGIENLANLAQLPATGATLFVGAPKHGGGTGGPARVLAVL
ncbi:cyclase family protein [Wenxinia saemankumensis]|uniref:Kynurenine formamidase n=1 Tax=Wenxinia saemankumensis TaxID=1447782 RepID=A0A1M6ANN3_9RHOB|nr:cyclase family protein [Wenxinia saemankumensis]SHI38082.1 Kynurenine formamidase [Wenxinia saemankumensis]